MKKNAKYTFKLFVVANTLTCEDITRKLTVVLEKNFHDEYDLEIIDIIESPGLAIQENVLATPTLIKESPLPPKRIVGNIGDEKNILTALGLN